MKTSPKSTKPKRWEIFFEARPGPKRVVKKRIDGLEYRAKLSKLELPPTQNDRLHWRVRAKVVADWRHYAAALVSTFKIPSLKRVKISAIIHRRSVGRADWSGDVERIKPLVDGMVDAGVVPDDRRQFVEYGSILEQKWDERGLGITLILEEIER